MEQGKRFGPRLNNALSTVIVVLTLAAFLAVTLSGLFVTCYVDDGFSEDNNERVTFLPDQPLLHLAVLAGALAAGFVLLRRTISRRAVNLALCATLVLLTVLGAWWVTAAKALPGSDAGKIVDEAKRLASGDVSQLRDSPYFRTFPFQLGYLLFCEAFARVFGVSRILWLGYLNVLLVDAAYLAVFCITRRLFDERRTELAVVVLLGLCFQPVFLCTFLYGVIPGLAAALWAVYFLVCYLQDGGGLGKLAAMALLLALAVTLKKNYAIVLIACCIVLLLYAVRTKKIRLPLGAALAGIALALALPAAVQRGYERRADTAFGAGTPQTAWLVTGFRESSMCAGWFNSYTTTVLADNDFDVPRTRAQVRADLNEQLTMFAERPRYLVSFLGRKVISQWNEPAFQCIWSSSSEAHDGPLSPAVVSLYEGGGERAINAWFNRTVQLVFFGLTAALVLLLRRKNRTEARLLLPLVMLGAFCYHALFEAKAQYALICLPMMLPYAAYALSRWTAWAEARLSATSSGKRAA